MMLQQRKNVIFILLVAISILTYRIDGTKTDDDDNDNNDYNKNDVEKPQDSLRDSLQEDVTVDEDKNKVQYTNATTTNTTTNTTTTTNGITIPDQFCSPFGSYPDLLNLTTLSMSQREIYFHPIVILPNNKNNDATLPVSDNTNRSCLGTVEDIAKAKEKQQSQLFPWQQWWYRVTSKPSLFQSLSLLLFHKQKNGERKKKYLSPEWSIGKYDENRVSMYTSELFQNADNKIDGYGGQRTVHLGVDIGAPVGTKVYAFSDGIIHSVGYNPDHGDYGYVVVIEHSLPPQLLQTESKKDIGEQQEEQERKVWALYGHLAKDGIYKKKVGAKIKKGAMVGRIGDCHENGGWKFPHVHFQLSLTPPTTHDMPGACSVEDRPVALMNYPDPRYILGPVH